MQSIHDAVSGSANRRQRAYLYFVFWSLFVCTTSQSTILVIAPKASITAFVVVGGVTVLALLVPLVLLFIFRPKK